MRFVVALLGGALAVLLITLIALGIYSMFPNDDDLIPVTPIDLDKVVLETDYTLEGLQCKCKSEQLEFERQVTPSGLGCKASILSVRQLKELPECDIDPKRDNTKSL
ncbi:hypothetical protein [Pleionea sediminis]|uniref:hypothetical protein n=1 Tax=Pleionea sediminis TaxID=2569479 RepID=UPI0011872170|nr:hypothetical protein [Pleionea sediminis]